MREVLLDLDLVRRRALARGSAVAEAVVADSGEFRGMLGAEMFEDGAQSRDRCCDQDGALFERRGVEVEDGVDWIDVS